VTTTVVVCVIVTNPQFPGTGEPTGAVEDVLKEVDVVVCVVVKLVDNDCARRASLVTVIVKDPSLVGYLDNVLVLIIVLVHVDMPLVLEELRV
jgi:hypothetical protein